jgi:hypothetical protein
LGEQETVALNNFEPQGKKNTYEFSVLLSLLHHFEYGWTLEPLLIKLPRALKVHVIWL